MNPAYTPATTRNVRIAGEVCTEMDGDKWADFITTAAYFAALPSKRHEQHARMQWRMAGGREGA